MAARPWRVILPALLAVLTVWVWVLAGVLYVIRWNSVERPLPPPIDVFRYGELRIGVEGSTPPFAVATADDLFGFDIDLGRALGEHLQLPVRFVNLGYDGLYDALRVDQVDIVIASLTADPSRRGEVMYTLPYFDAGLVLVSAAGSPMQTMENLPGHALAYEFGSLADAEARLWLRRVLPFETRPYELPVYALDAVRLGQADAALVDAVSARLYRREQPDWPLQMTPVTSLRYVIPVRLDQGRVWEAVNEALRSLSADGTLDQLLARWL